MLYEKTDNLLDLALLMQANREGISLEDIRNKFGCSRRTAERMKNMILVRFPQTQERKGENNKKYWFIPQGTLRDFISFTADDLACLELAKKALLKSKMEDKASQMDDIIKKITANITPKTYNRIAPDAENLLRAEGFAHKPGPKLIIDDGILSDLRMALICCNQVKIEYTNKRTKKTRTYTLNPYGFLYGDRNHYLLGVHSDGFADGKVHNYILNNIQSVEILNETFEMPTDFSLQKYTEQSFGVFQEEPFEVEWLFDKEVADDAEKMQFHPTQTTKRNEDGSLTVCFKAGGRLEMDWYLYTWGDKVKVIKG